MVHAELYQKCRAEAWQTYQARRQELEALWKEMNEASMQMMGAQQGIEQIQEDNKYAEQLAAMQKAMTLNETDLQQPVDADLAESTQEVQQIEDSDMEEGEEQELSKVKDPKSRHTKSFVASTSPTRVANQNLKVKAPVSKQGAWLVETQKLIFLGSNGLVKMES